jgi:hypothetical protein
MTAVEWLVEQLAKNGLLHSSDIAKAKEMEKEQIDKAISDEFNNHIRRTTTMHELVIQNCINNGDIIPFDDTKHEKKYDNLKERNGRFG